MSNAKKSVFIVLLILAVDQTVKIIVKTHMFYGQSVSLLGNWFIIRFIENPGMAFGIDIPGKSGKIVLTLFRIVAVIGIIWYLRKLIHQKATTGLVVCLSLVLAGAIGNIIDSAFYGLLFSESMPFSGQVAKFLPADGGYSSFLHGKVVDMFYFPVIHGHFPNWFPIWKGEEFEFFRPVFNIADITLFK